MEMNSRERVLAALNREDPDRVPYCELNVDRSFAQKLEGSEAYIGNSALQQGNPFTLDEAKALSTNLGLDNMFYLLRQPVYSKSHAGKDGRQFSGDGMIKTEADLELIDLPDPHNDELYAEAEEFVKNKGDFALFFLTRMGLAPVMLSMGIQNFSLALYDNPGLVEKLLDIYFDWMVVVAERVNQLGFDVFATADDCAFKTGLMFSPQIFRDMIAPRYRRILEKITIPWVFHSDGNTTEVLDILIDLGVAGVHPFENTAVDIREIKHDFGDRICVLGNVDLNTLGMGTPDDTDQEVRALIRDLGPGGGYIVTSGNSLAEYLKPECVLAMSAAVRKYGRYPIDFA